MKTFLLSIMIAGFCQTSLAADDAQSEGPPVTITLGPRHAHVTPQRLGFTHSGGGNIHVTQEAPDRLVVTMTGVAVAGGHPGKNSSATMDFALEQCFRIDFAPGVRRAKLSIEGRVVGLLRSHRIGGGTAGHAAGVAAITCGSTEIATVTLPPHMVCGGENQSVNCHMGPVEVPLLPGTYSLRQMFTVAAQHTATLLPCKAASAEFAPEPGLDPLWISHSEPFHGAAKDDFGYQIVISVSAE